MARRCRRGGALAEAAAALVRRPVDVIATYGTPASLAAKQATTTIPIVMLQGIPAYIRSDNGPEFLAKAVRKWIAVVGAKTAYIERGSPWENGYIESFSARLPDELLDGEIFYTLREAQIVIESWRRHYNTIRPHASLRYKPPAPEVFVPATSPRGRLRYANRLRRPR
jgi:transposase InsO family protein